MARLDVLDAALAAVKEAGAPNPVLSMSDAARHPEATVVSTGTPLPGRRYFDGTGTTVQRVTVTVKSIEEEGGLRTAEECARQLNRRGAMESRNGSYRLVRCEAERPRFLTWDPAGRYLYALDCQIEYEDL